ncbi:MAG: toll/interleukin-1 receptor domain-containing protein [Bacteroidota bacterium]
MALIPGFEYDIFVSYAHVDNIVPVEGELGWIAQFHSYLKQMLDKRHGRVDAIKIWWDTKRLDGGVLFDKEIASGIEKSAIMVCLNSPGYQQSDYCQQELELFYNKALKEPQGLEVRNRPRILNILLNNIHHKEWPTSLKGTSGFPFHDSEDQEDLGDPLEVGSVAFTDKIKEVRDALWELIKELQEQPQRGSPEKKEQESEDARFTIFLGEVPDSLRTLSGRVTTELTERGYEVISGIPPPYPEKEHEEAVRNALEECDLAVHLLDRYAGRQIDGGNTIWYPQRQAEIALESENTPPLLWIPEETDFETVEEEDYKAFLENVEVGKASSGLYEFIRGSKSTLAAEIVDFAEQIKVSRQVVPSEDEKLAVLLDTHFKDQSYAFDLGKALLENEIQPFINPHEDDPRKNINFLADRIGRVSKMIFLYGKVSKEWVLERMSAALQLIITRNYPVEEFFVYMAPPEKRANEILINQKFLQINVVDQSKKKTLDKIGLHKFLNDLKGK